MIKLGEIQKLEILRFSSVGAFLNSEEDPSIDDVLLPTKQIPEGSKVGDLVEVFIYKDSEDRTIATTKMPKIVQGKVEVLYVNDTNKYGAFLNWGLNKDLMLPFGEQRGEVKKNKKYPVILYIDSSNRLCATMNIYERLESDAPYFEGEKVKGIIYQINEEIGAFVAVDGKYHGMIPASQLLGMFRVGETVEAKISKVREDGKLELSVREGAKESLDGDSQMIMDRLMSSGGRLAFGDKSEPEAIYTEFKISKKAFKRATGKLYKDRRIIVGDFEIKIAE